MASTKRGAPEDDEPEAFKKAKFDDASSSSEPKPKQRVVLNPADCDLDFTIEGNGLQGYALHEQGFAYCWSGACANVGIRGGKYCFSCKIISIQPVEMEDTSPEQKNVCRLGVSRGDDSVGNLGETEHSFGFGGTGKFSNDGKFLDYGEKFGVGDTIVCTVNLEEKPFASIGFSKNGKWLGIAKKFDAGPKGLGVVHSPVRKLQWKSAFYPHVLLKNVVVQLQFSVEDGLVPEEGFKPWESALEDGNAVMGPIFSDIGDCEVIMMVGLPASGKTTWAEKWVKEHPEKRYLTLGTNLALDRMKVPGHLRKQNYGERFDHLMDRATGVFNTPLSRAANTHRNYIIDQTNVFKSARKRKLKPFALFKKIAVVVFPQPGELMLRSKKRFQEMGKEVPADAVNNMLANYVLPINKDMPGSDEYFDEVVFSELDQVESQRSLDEMKWSLEPKSNSNSRNDSSPYPQGSSVWSSSTSSYSPWESPIRPHPMPSLQYQGPSTVTSENWMCSYLPAPPSKCTNYQILDQVTGQLGSTRSLPEAYRGKQSFPAHKATTLHGTCTNSNYESSFHRDNSGYYPNYGVETCSRSDVDGNSNNFGASINNYSSNSMIEPLPLESTRASLHYNVSPAHYSGPQNLSSYQQAAPRAPPFCPSPLAPYGSPYGTQPQAPRPQ
ncbi:heterogeneous nuclear ribonucleoprotein U-like protein 1 [Morus notabilis]|uniref:heterogeneous nuclear ribonucleoprotein U-like protein 1 n=1 Tax=Morus notabilis TaxID=981085 RepID=UPI000CED0722|nr:heterogeneous nuclear ribonucleoprotein U-like protein 1 [Morus notabilis]